MVPTSFLQTFCFLKPPLFSFDFFFFSHVRQITSGLCLSERKVGQIPLPAWKSCSPQSTSYRLSHKQLGNTWNSQSCKEEAWHLPNGENSWSESAVWKTSTLSSEISSTAGHKTRDNKGKQPGQGGVSAPSPLTFGNSISKGCEPLAAFTAPLPYTQKYPSTPKWACYPGAQPATGTQSIKMLLPSFNATAHTCSEEVVQDFRCPGGEKLLQRYGFACGNGWLPSILPPAAWGKREQALWQVTCTLLNCQRYFWLLQAGASAIEKKRLIKAQAMRFFWFS